MRVNVVIRMVKLACWICTHGSEQRWGHSVSGRYRTDWNNCSLACLERAEHDAMQNHELGVGLSHDQILAVAQIEAHSIFHPLQVVNESVVKQYKFWQAVFGTEAMHNSLYVFEVSNVFAFRAAVALPVTQRKRLQSFFAQLDLHSAPGLIRQCFAESADVPEWLNADASLFVRLPAAQAFHIASGQSSFFCLPDPAPEYLFSAGVRVKKKTVGWHFVHDLVGDFAMPANSEPVRSSFTVDSANDILTTIRELVSRLPPDDTERGQALLRRCASAAEVLQQFQDEMAVSSLSQRVVQSQGRVCQLTISVSV